MIKIVFEEDIFREGIDSLLSQEGRIDTLKLALNAEDAARIGDATVFIVFDPPAEEGGVECVEVHLGNSDTHTLVGRSNRPGHPRSRT
jgi:hypothetical protein